MSVDMLAAIKPKSNQLNSDDLWGGPITIHIRDVTEGISADQPIAIYFDNDNGKPYLPSKGMRRVMVAVWGKEAKDYVGRSMTIFRDPKVVFGGVETGGIRISHMSHITADQKIAVAMNKTSRKPVIIKPLAAAAKSAPAALDIEKLKENARIATNGGVDDYRAFFGSLSKDERTALLPFHEAMKAAAEEAERNMPANAEDESEPEPTTNEEAA